MSGEELEPSALEALADAWEAAWTSPGPPLFADCCTPDVQYEDPVVVEPLTGTDALTMSARRLREAFPDMRLERTAPRIAQGRFGCLPWRLLGTHRGELGGLPASGRFVIVHGIHYIEVSDGLIRRARGFFDLYGAATQLGLLPERGGLAETALLLLRGFGLRARG